MTDHAIFIRIGDSAFLESGHGGERLVHARLHRLEKFLGEIHPADVQ
jgi:hypothetical protein